MSAAQRQSVTVAEPLTDERQPTHSGLSVVFKGDGEPKTARETMRSLSEFEETVGLEEDTYTLGGTVERLETKFADMMGKEAAVFMPTGSLANHLAIRKHCGVRSAAIVQEQSHLYHDTGDTVPRLSGINLIPLAPGRTCFSVRELEAAVNTAEGARVDSQIGAVMVESPVRRQAGQIVPYDQMREITELLPPAWAAHPLRRRQALHDVRRHRGESRRSTPRSSTASTSPCTSTSERPSGPCWPAHEAFISDLFQHAPHVWGQPVLGRLPRRGGRVEWAWTGSKSGSRWP